MRPVRYIISIVKKYIRKTEDKLCSGEAWLIDHKKGIVGVVLCFFNLVFEEATQKVGPIVFTFFLEVLPSFFCVCFLAMSPWTPHPSLHPWPA